MYSLILWGLAFVSANPALHPSLKDSPAADRAAGCNVDGSKADGTEQGTCGNGDKCHSDGKCWFGAK